MPTAALYHWTVAGSPVEILVDLGLVDRLRIAAAASPQETGGILLGYYEDNYCVINGFEAIDSEHRRGAAYTLSQRDEARLASRLELKRKRAAALPVGFFRTHLRPGMFLDEGDNHVLSSFFSNPNQVALLIKPSTDCGPTGGFFFWEDGEMNRKQSYLPFPLSSRELESGDFPLVEPAAPRTASGALAADVPVSEPAFEDAETADATRFNERSAAANESLPSRSRNAETHVGTVVNDGIAKGRSHNLAWQLIGLVAALAAFGGYLIGTSGTHRDRFGARSGDITLNSAPPEPQTPAPAPVTPIDRASRPSVMPPAAAPDNSPAAPPAETSTAAPPIAGPTVAESKTNAAKPIPAPKASVAIPAAQKAKLSSGDPETATRSEVQGAKSLASAATAPVSPESGNWQHFHSQPAASGVPPGNGLTSSLSVPPVEATTRPLSPSPAPMVLSSVSLESVESGGVGKAFSKIPLLGGLHRSRSGENFTPAQALRSAAPKVPTELARELTGMLPVDLRLKVDATGRVSSVEIISHQSPAEFVRLAGDAAYDWKFEPARVKDRVVSSDVIAHFKFRPAL